MRDHWILLYRFLFYILNHKTALPLILLSFIPLLAPAQKKTKVNIENADKLTLDKRGGRNVQVLYGNVMMRQENTYFYCDSAVLDNSANNLKAFGKVHINYNDSVNVYGDFLDYSSNTRIAVLDSNVKLVDKHSTLTSDHLIYNRATDQAFYNTGGRIISENNTLVSRTGLYFTTTREFLFKDSVILTNPDYTLRSDTLVYNTETEMAYIPGHAAMTGKDDSVICRNGWYDTRSDIFHLKDRPRIFHQEQSIEADSIYYNKREDYGYGYRDVILRDTVQDVILKGDFLNFNKKTKNTYLTGLVTAILVDDKDSLYMHADTIRLVNDSLDQADKLFAYNQMKFYRRDLQGMADSLVYDIQDSTIHLFQEPVLWSDENQLIADSIRIYVSKNRVDSINLVHSAFIISQDSDTSFNQIKGRNMTGYFRNNDLFRIGVSGNAETIYFVREEDQTMIGINKAISSYMIISLEENKVVGISYLQKPDVIIYPENEVKAEDLILKGFLWKSDRRPLRMESIYTW